MVWCLKVAHFDRYLYLSPNSTSKSSKTIFSQSTAFSLTLGRLSKAMESTCQITAMMFTDIVGSTALLGKDSARPWELVRINWESQKPHVEKHGRKWCKEMDDGATAQFNRALDAVNCAVEIQKLALSLLIFLVLVGTFWSISASAQKLY